MVERANRLPRILELADRIEDDIRRRGLGPGDPYDSTACTARRLGVSTSAANRALQVLVKRRRLERRQRRGTFIAAPPSGDPGPAVGRVHLLVERNYLRVEGLLGDGVLVGIQQELPAASLQFEFLPPRDDGPYVDRLITDALKSPEAEGFVLVRSSLTSQRLVEASGVPAVVFGTTYPSIRRLPSIDRDHSQVGRILVDRLVELGARRLLVLLRSRALPGDHQLVDALLESAVRHRIGANDIVLRFLPPDEEVVCDEVSALLSRSGRATGILCRSLPLAEGADLAAQRLGLAGSARPSIAVSDVYRQGSRESRFTWARSLWRPEEVGVRIGRLLAEQVGAGGAVGGPDDVSREVISVAVEADGSEREDDRKNDRKNEETNDQRPE